MSPLPNHASARKSGIFFFIFACNRLFTSGQTLIYVTSENLFMLNVSDRSRPKQNKTSYLSWTEASDDPMQFLLDAALTRFLMISLLMLEQKSDIQLLRGLQAKQQLACITPRYLRRRGQSRTEPREFAPSCPAPAGWEQNGSCATALGTPGGCKNITRCTSQSYLSH